MNFKKYVKKLYVVDNIFIKLKKIGEKNNKGAV